MSVFLIVAGYGILSALTTCRIASLLAWHWMQRHNEDWSPFSSRTPLRTPNGDQWSGAIALGLVAGVAWPVAVVAWVARGFLFRPPERVLAARQAERIAELEKELEL